MYLFSERKGQGIKTMRPAATARRDSYRGDTRSYRAGGLGAIGVEILRHGVWVSSARARIVSLIFALCGKNVSRGFGHAVSLGSLPAAGGAGVRMCSARSARCQRPVGRGCECARLARLARGWAGEAGVGGRSARSARAEAALNSARGFWRTVSLGSVSCRRCAGWRPLGSLGSLQVTSHFKVGGVEHTNFEAAQVSLGSLGSLLPPSLPSPPSSPCCRPRHLHRPRHRCRPRLRCRPRHLHHPRLRCRPRLRCCPTSALATTLTAALANAASALTACSTLAPAGECVNGAAWQHAVRTTSMV